MPWALVDLLLGANGGSSPVGTLAMVVIAIALVAIAVALFRRTMASPRRSAVELHAIITAVPSGHGDAATWSFVIQARPGETRTELLEQLRDRLPEQYQAGALTFFSIEPNVIGAGANRIAPRKPSDIKECWASDSSAAADPTWEVAA